MSFPRYERYKESGVEWLGEVPEHWSVDRFDAFTRTHRRSVAPAALTNLRILHFSIPNIQDFGQGIEEDGSDVDSNKLVVHERQLLVSKLNPHKQTLIIAAPHAELLTVASTEFVPLIPMTANLGYLRYVWLSTTAFNYLLSRTDSATRSHQRVNPDDISKSAWCFPPSTEQSIIAQFLDLETAKIDALIEEQRRLIELLKEKRQAVISHAVTKGLDPDAHLRHSGHVEIGSTPQHWTVSKLRYFAPFRRGHDLTQDQQEEGQYPVVTSGGVTGRHSSFMQRGPGVVTGRYGSTGKLFYISENFWPHNTSLYVQSFCGNVPRYVWYSLHTVNFALHSAKSAVPGIDRNDLDVLPVAVPPVEEQSRVVAFLDVQMETFDTLVNEAIRITELLQERRSALISAAVTGKIDVRNYAKQNTEEAA